MQEALPERIIGEYQIGDNGPLLFILAGLHGNEPAGIFALRRVFATLHELKPPFQGRFIGLSGNRKALALKQRYVDRDLNRLWSEEEIERVKNLRPEDRNSEEAELLEILEILEPSIQSDFEPKIFADLHTTSGRGGIFSIVTEEPKIRELAEHLYAPIVFNLVNELALTTNKFFENRNLIGLAFESGQHDDPSSIDIHEAAIWVLLTRAGCVQESDIPHFQEFKRKLKDASSHLSRYLTVCYRHPINSGNGFHMKSGYHNFQNIRAGELLARDKNGTIISPADGQILMPLYQKQGEDGFFVIQEIPEPPV